MHRSAALPFIIRRSQDVVRFKDATSTTETVHGLLRLDGDRLIVQWRVQRSTQKVTAFEARTDKEVEPVREVVVPLSGLASATVRRSSLWQLNPRIVLTAADLRAFEEIAGVSGLRLDHPAELALRIRRSDILPAHEFAAELELAIAELALAVSEERSAPALGSESASALPAPQPAMQDDPAAVLPPLRT